MASTAAQFLLFSKWIRKQLAGVIKQNTEAIRAAQERYEQQQHVAPFWVNNILSDYKKTVGDKSANENRHQRTQESIKRAAWCAFWAASIYAALSYGTWSEMRFQNDIAMTNFRRARIDANGQLKQTMAQSEIAAQNANTASQALVENRREFTDSLAQLQKQTTAQIKAADAAQGANRLAADSFELIQRPWVGMEGIVSPSIPMQFVGNNVGYYGKLVIKNFGTAPALKIAYSVSLAPTVSEIKRASNTACQSASDWIRKGIQDVQGDTDNTKGGIVLFPGDTHPAGFTAGATIMTGKMPESVWLMGCIVYEEPSGKEHWTRFCNVGVPGDNIVPYSCDMETHAD